MIVLDASALLALLFTEPGHEAVRDRLHASCMSAVNLTEVLARFVRDGHDAVAVLQRLQTSVEVVPFTEQTAAIAAMLVPLTADAGLSLADRACLALGLERGLTVLTADRAWVGLEIGIEVLTIR